MSLPSFVDPDIGDAAEEAARQPAKNRAELKVIITALVVALTRFLVSIVALPLRGIVHVLVAERFAAEEAKMREKLLAEMQPHVDRQIKTTVAAVLAELRKELGEEKCGPRAELLKELHAAQIPPERTYPFAVFGGVLGGAAGGVAAWLWAVHLNITPPELQAVALTIGIGACMVAAVGTLMGCLIDAIRDRLPKEQ